jgi:hypothetical protein
VRPNPATKRAKDYRLGGWSQGATLTGEAKMADPILTLSVTCPHCDKAQHIVANRAPDTAMVRCWSCREVLGIWHDLAAVSRRTAAWNTTLPT